MGEIHVATNYLLCGSFVTLVFTALPGGFLEFCNSLVQLFSMDITVFH